MGHWRAVGVYTRALPGGRHESIMADKDEKWWAIQDSNLWLPPCEGGTLPLS
jgi:hypothetical protein